MIEIFTIYFDDLYDKKTDRYLHLILTTTFFNKNWFRTGANWNQEKYFLDKKFFLERIKRFVDFQWIFLLIQKKKIILKK